MENTNIPLQPLQDNLLLRMDTKEEVSSGGIYIPEKAQERPCWGTVEAAGKEALWVIVGDRVYAPVHLGTAINRQGTSYVLIREAQCLAYDTFVE